MSAHRPGLHRPRRCYDNIVLSGEEGDLVNLRPVSFVSAYYALWLNGSLDRLVQSGLKPASEENVSIVGEGWGGGILSAPLRDTASYPTFFLWPADQ